NAHSKFESANAGRGRFCQAAPGLGKRAACYLNVCDQHRRESKENQCRSFHDFLLNLRFVTLRCGAIESDVLVSLNADGPSLRETGRGDSVILVSIPSVKGSRDPRIGT